MNRLFGRPRRQVSAGDIIAIPLERGFAIAKVVYVSEYFRHVIAIRVVAQRFAAAEKPHLDSAGWLPRVIYTGSQSIPKYWKKLGETDVSPGEMALTRRVVAGKVWEMDTELGPPSAAERRDLRSMGVLGMFAVQDVLHGQLP